MLSKVLHLQKYKINIFPWVSWKKLFFCVISWAHLWKYFPHCQHFHYCHHISPECHSFHPLPVHLKLPWKQKSQLYRGNLKKLVETKHRNRQSVMLQFWNPTSDWQRKYQSFIFLQIICHCPAVYKMFLLFFYNSSVKHHFRNEQWVKPGVS